MHADQYWGLTGYGPVAMMAIVAVTLSMVMINRFQCFDDSELHQKG